MERLLEGEALEQKAKEYGIKTTRYVNKIAQRVDEEELQLRVREFERDAETSERERKLFRIVLIETVATVAVAVVAILALVLRR